MRVVGKVKSFDRATGTGCALADSGAQAVFTSETLKPFGLYAIDEGVTLSFELTLERGRLTVAKIYEIAGKGPHPGAATWSDKPPPPPAPEMDRHVKGRVLWFDAAKGYGFVGSKDIVGDVLLHRAVLEAFGIGSIREGAVLEFDLIRKIRGLQVSRLHAVLAPEQPLPPPVEPPGGSVIIRGGALHLPGLSAIAAKSFAALRKIEFCGADADDAPVWEDAVCKWFSRPKGFGFLRLVEGGEDIFVHMDLLRRSGIRELKPGQRVRVETVRTERGLTAVAIELVWDDDVGHA